MKVYAIYRGAPGESWYDGQMIGVYSTRDKAKDAKKRIVTQYGSPGSSGDESDWSNYMIFECELDTEQTREIEDNFNYTTLENDNNWET